MSLKSLLSCLIEHGICETIIASFITTTAFEEQTIICCCLMMIKQTTKSKAIYFNESGAYFIAWIWIFGQIFPSMWPDVFSERVEGE